MHYREIIAEAGIQTAEVDRAARAAINQRMPDIVRVLRQNAAPDIGPYAPVADKDGGNGDYNSEYYDKLYKWFTSHRVTVILAISNEIDRVLTKVANDIGLQRYGQNKANENHVKVNMVAGELSREKQKSGGYHFPGIIRFYIDGEAVVHAALGLVQESLFGEEVEDYRRRFLGLIVPVFVHEYAHYEQGARGKDWWKPDLGYITVGSRREKVGGKRRGKRGGYHRDQDKTEEGYLRYIGSSHEIDAYASSAAAEMVHDMHQNSYDSKSQFNRNLNDLRRSIADGYATSNDHDRYYRKYQESIRQEWPGLDHEKMTKVWHRFMRLLYQKLGDYLHPVAGKTADVDGEDSSFVEKAKSLRMPEMIAYLARITARSVVGQETSPDRISRLIDNGYADIMSKAEAFISHYYFGDEIWEKEKQFDRVVSMYRAMAKRYALRLATKK